MKTKLMTLLTFTLALVLLVGGLASCAPATEEPAAPEPTKEVAPEPTEEAAPPPEPVDVCPPGDPVQYVSDGSVDRGGTLRTEYAWMPYVEDPAADGVGTGYVGLSIAEPLVWVGGAGVPQPQLAKSWEANADASVWTIHLQGGVKFNNGMCFSADDVIWNLKHWLDPDTGASTAAKLDMLQPEGIKKIDDLTIELTLDRPNADLMLVFYDYPTMIAPEGGWTDFYSGDPADAIGTGPFMLESFTPDERFVLVPNPNYWQLGADGEPLPYVDKVVITAGWDDAARLAALIGDEADRLSPGEAILEELLCL